MNNTEGGGGLLPHFENRAADYYAFDWVGPQTWAQHLHYQLEMVYVEKGMLDVTIDFQTWHLRAGDLAIIFPYCVHGYHIDPDCAPDNHVLGIMALPPMAGEFEERLPVQLPQSPVLTGDQLNEEIIQAWYRLFIEREHYRPMIAKFYLQLLLALLWPLLDVVTVNERSADDAYRAVRYVIEHYREPLQARMVSEALGISPSRLARLFSSQLITKGERHLLDHSRVYDRVRRTILAEGPQRGQIRDDVTVNELSKLYALLERGLMYDWCICNGDYSLKSYAERTMPMLLAAFQKK